MKTSLVIPCHPAHEKHLQPLLALLEMQTETPDEVIIVAPKACVLTSTLEVRFVETADVLWPGEARNQGAKASQGDLIFFQDADDDTHRVDPVFIGGLPGKTGPAGKQEN